MTSRGRGVGTAVGLRLLFLAAVWLTGCGGGTSPGTGSNLGTGSIKLNIDWPKAVASRLIPANTQSIRVVVYTWPAGSSILYQTTITRPSSSGTITGVTPGSYLIYAVAYDGSGGTGTQLAMGNNSSPVVVTAGNATACTITMFSLARTLTVTLNPTTVVDSSANTVVATASVKDAGGSAVPVDASKISWSWSPSAVFTGASTGNPITLTCVNGTVSSATPVTVTATYAEGTGASAVSITNSASVTVNPVATGSIDVTVN